MKLNCTHDLVAGINMIVVETQISNLRFSYAHSYTNYENIDRQQLLNNVFEQDRWAK